MLMLLGNLVRVLPRRTLSLLESILITLEGLGMLLILCMLRKSFHISTKYLSSYHNDNPIRFGSKHLCVFAANLYRCGYRTSTVK
jgi:hypothetical protein